MTETGAGAARLRVPSHSSSVFHGTRMGDANTSSSEVAISTILGALSHGT